MRHNDCSLKMHPYHKTMYHDKYAHAARYALNAGVFILMTAVTICYVIYSNPLNLMAKSSQFWAARAQLKKRPIENCSKHPIIGIDINNDKSVAMWLLRCY